MKPRPIEVLKEDIEIAVVPLGKDGQHGHAFINLEDYRWLMKAGSSGNWSKLSRGYVVAPSRKVDGNNVIVARVLLRLGEREFVSYKDGDPTNLRRSNLETAPYGRAKGKVATDALAINEDPFFSAIKPFKKDGRTPPKI